MRHKTNLLWVVLADRGREVGLWKRFIKNSKSMVGVIFGQLIGQSVGGMVNARYM